MDEYVPEGSNSCVDGVFFIQVGKVNLLFQLSKYFTLGFVKFLVNTFLSTQRKLETVISSNHFNTIKIEIKPCTWGRSMSHPLLQSIQDTRGHCPHKVPLPQLCPIKRAQEALYHVMQPGSVQHLHWTWPTETERCM